MFKFRQKLTNAALGAGLTIAAGCLGFMVSDAFKASLPLSKMQAVAQTASTSFRDLPVHNLSTVAKFGGLNDGTASFQTDSLGLGSQRPMPSDLARGRVCQALSLYPKSSTDELSFHVGAVSNVCQPFIKYQRHDLDRCGDQKSDPYLSKFTWPTRQEMSRRGKVNVFASEGPTNRLPELMARAESLRARATDLCCAPGDLRCRSGMAAVRFDVCRPSTDPNAPDPCVFGGTYRMPGTGYDSIFRAISRVSGSASGSTSGAGELKTQLRAIARTNLQGRSMASTEPIGLTSGSITLSSYISVDTGAQSMDPVILHELGHACSMVKMQEASLDQAHLPKAVRAAQWLDSAKHRCDPDFKFPEAADDFWESLGETRELSSCLKDLAVMNQKKKVDKPCNDLCPGHYLEESVGIAFSLLIGDLDGGVSASFPNTCDHVRDGQHPMVSDVAECLMQNSPRFRARMAQTYSCREAGALASIAGSAVKGAKPSL